MEGEEDKVEETGTDTGGEAATDEAAKEGDEAGE